MSRSERWIVGALFTITLLAFFFPLSSLQFPVVGTIDVSGYDVLSKSQQLKDRLMNLQNPVSELSTEAPSASDSHSPTPTSLPYSIRTITALPFEILGSFGLSAISLLLCVIGASRGAAKVSSTAASILGIGSILHIVMADSDLHGWLQAQIRPSANQTGDNPFGTLVQNIGSLVANAFHLRPGAGLYALAASASVGALFLHSGLLSNGITDREPAQSDQHLQSDAGARLFAFVVTAVLVVGAAVYVLRHQATDQIPARPTGPMAAHVPFVGCPADGQAGPVNPPHEKDKLVSIPLDLAQEFAYYSAGNSGVLAPRGWHCFEVYGSSGGALFVAPGQFDSATIFSGAWPGFTGPAIELSNTSTDTSGRFEAARTIARAFPAQMEFVRQVEAEGIDEDAPYPAGPFPTDTLKYINRDAVEYLTPPNERGLGTLSKLKVNDGSIMGVAILRLEKGSLIQLSVRLPNEMVRMRPIIIQELERETLKQESIR